MTDPNLLLDVSRTVARARLPAPTGIDRVERAYIDWALGRSSLFLARIDDRQHLIPLETIRALTMWLDGVGTEPRRDLRAHLRPMRPRRLAQAQSLIRQGALASFSDPAELASAVVGRLDTPVVYLNTGHDNCTDTLMRAFAGAGIGRLVMIHDTIPLDHPEFVRPETPGRFRAMLAAAALADGLLANSEATATQVDTHLGDLTPPCWAAPLGVERRAGPAPTMASHPMFLCIGTIEPRKNHALLLHLWQQMHASRPADHIPHLHIIGRRGWMNEAVFHDLDTLPFMGETVFEQVLDDAELAVRMASARAVLFPSLAEGYGLPLAEALAVGTPVIASDLPVLREIGRDVPEFLPISDIAAWQGAIDAYAQHPAPRRQAQIDRLTSWKTPGWTDHFAIVENALETILVQTHPHR